MSIAIDSWFSFYKKYEQVIYFSLYDMNTFENLQNTVGDKPISLVNNLPNSLESLLAMSNANSSTCCATGTCS